MTSYPHHEELPSINQEFLTQFGQLSQEQLNWKGNAETWSIAQNIDHIIRINESYYPLIEDLKAGKREKPLLARIPFFVKLFGNLIYKSVQADNPKKVKTLGIWKPSKSAIPSDIVQKLSDHNEALAKLISSCDHLVEEGVIISSPANKNIVYKLEKAFDILVSHERRHLEQARQVLLAMPKQ
jgi:hypothetical protein